MIILPILAAAALIGLDQLTKYMAFQYLQPLGSVPLLGNFLKFTFVKNDGAAFGVLSGGRWFFVPLTIVMVGAIIFYYITLPKDKSYYKMRLVLALIFAGAVGNFVDRFRNGYVVDFIQVNLFNFPVFNLADMCLVVGIILLALLLLFFVKDDRQTRRAEA